MKNIKVFQTRQFEKQKKKLKPNQINDLGKAINKIMDDPNAGQQKIGDLSSIWVFKFKMVNQVYLLGYQWDPETRTLIALAVHENLYRDLKKSIKK